MKNENKKWMCYMHRLQSKLTNAYSYPKGSVDYSWLNIRYSVTKITGYSKYFNIMDYET